jgi:hypothetical protein
VNRIGPAHILKAANISEVVRPLEGSEPEKHFFGALALFRPDIFFGNAYAPAGLTERCQDVLVYYKGQGIWAARAIVVSAPKRLLVTIV